MVSMDQGSKSGDKDQRNEHSWEDGGRFPVEISTPDFYNYPKSDVERQMFSGS
jgi:hypothetical protein